MGRVVDRGAIFAGWVGLGMAVVVAISLELIIAVQTLVFLAAPLMGALIGWYADARSDRRRPWGRVLANALYAGAVTGIGLALLYGAVRLVFIYGDGGYRDPLLGGQIQCAGGPACTYQRYLLDGRAADLAQVGVTDAATFERYLLAEQLNGGLVLVGTTLGGALVGGVVAGLRGRRPVDRGALAAT